MARAYASGAVALLALLLALELLGGRQATVALTGSMSPSAPLGLLYVLAWLLALAAAPSLLLAALFEAALDRVGRRAGR